MLPTIVPRAVLLAVLVVTAGIVRRGPEARRGERSTARQRRALVALLGQPPDPGEPEGVFKDALWRITKGASTPHADAGERYVELLMENFGQPGFREVMLAVHDLDARRPDRRRAGTEWRHSFAHGAWGRAREAEMFDLVDGREHNRGLVMDFLAGAVRLPVASAPHEVTFPDNEDGGRNPPLVRSPRAREPPGR